MNFGAMMGFSGLVPWLQETFDGLAPLRDRMQQLDREAGWLNLTAMSPMGHIDVRNTFLEHHNLLGHWVPDEWHHPPERSLGGTERRDDR